MLLATSSDIHNVFQLTFKLQYIKKHIWQNVEHFKHGEPTIINILNTFHLYYRVFSLFQRILFIKTKSLGNQLSKTFSYKQHHQHRTIEIQVPIYTLLLAFVFAINQIFSRSTVFKNNLIELRTKHMIQSSWLSSDKINSALCRMWQICHWEKLPQKIAEILLNQF